MPKITSSVLKQTPIPLPPTEELKVLLASISSNLDGVGELVDTMNDMGARIGELDQSILAKAFRGELVPQDPNDEPAETLLARIALLEQNPPQGNWDGVYEQIGK